MTEDRRLGSAEVRRLLDQHGIVASKGLGQNFVTDPNTVDRIARLAKVSARDRVVEIGGGLGSLSLALQSTGAQVTVVEIDARLVRILRDILPASVRVIEADALHGDWRFILADDRSVVGIDDPQAVVIVANLPYNIATPLLLELLEHQPMIKRMLIMVQSEVGERMAASPGGREYGQVSVRIDYFAEVKIVGRVSREVFFPRPHVESVLVEIVRRDLPAVDTSIASYEEIVTLVRAGFSVRRKMLRRSLAGLVDPRAFEHAGIASSARAEELDVQSWGKLVRCQRSIASSPLQS